MENDLKTIGSKPLVLKGLLAGKIMNIIHSGFYRKIINEILIPSENNLSEMNILDIGCSGGASIKTFSKHPSVKRVYGIDYSEDMVKLSRKLNQKK